MKINKLIYSVVVGLVIMLASLTTVYAADFPTVINDDFNTLDKWNLTSGAGGVSDGMLKIAVSTKGTYSLTPKGWSIDGDYIAEVTAQINASLGIHNSNLGITLKQGTDGKTYCFSGVRYPANRDAGYNFGIGAGIGYETNAGFLKASGFVDVTKTCYLKFVVVGDSIEVLVRYSENEEYTSLVKYQNAALEGGTSQFGISIWENYPHNAGINLDKVVIYNTNCFMDSVTIGKGENEKVLSGSVTEPFAGEINVSFNTEMDTKYYENFAVYEKGNKEAKIDVSILSADSTGVKFGINERLLSGKQYVFDCGTQVTLDGTIFDNTGVLYFDVKPDDVILSAVYSAGKLSGSASFSENATNVTVIPVVYKGDKMLKVLSPFVLTSAYNTFSELDVGDIQSGSVIRLFGWNDANGTAIMCEPFTLEME